VNFGERRKKAADEKKIKQPVLQEVMVGMGKFQNKYVN